MSMKQIITRMACLAAVLSAFAFTVNADEKGAKANAKAIAMFSEKNYDFGYIKEEKGAVSHEFEFENVGDEPLIIVSATASCGCTRPEYPTKPIKPGKTGKIKVIYNPAGRPGPFRKKVLVKTNGKKGRYSLYVEGSVIPASESKN